MKNLFHFTRRERKGLYALSIILLILLMIRLFLYFQPLNHIQEIKMTAVNKKLDSIEKSAKKTSFPNHSRKKIAPKIKDSLFFFDPNKLDLLGWETLGLSKKQANVIIRYRTKGGQFVHKKDLTKIYIIDSTFYQKIEPFIKIKKEILKTPRKYKPNTKASETLSPLLINLNTSTKADLQKIKGIGEKYSSRIIKYRELLGGYINKKQLIEVYGIDQLLIDSISNKLFIDTSKLKKININEADEKTLAKHPYIKWNLANLIVKYKQKHGKYTVKQDLLNLELVDSNTLEKLIPYLILENGY